MEKETRSRWIAFGIAVGVLIIGAALIVFLFFLSWRVLRRAAGWSPSPPFSQAADYGRNGVLTIRMGSGMAFPGGTFEDRGRRLVTRRLGLAADPWKALGLARPPVILGAGPLPLSGRKAYYQAVLQELPRLGGAVHLISTIVLVDCPERGATGAVTLSLRAPPSRPVGAGADLRGTPADPQFLTDTLELSSANLCTFR
jgi:hypothetical protein